MILKISGAVLVLASSAFLGIYFAQLDSFRITDLNEWKKALLILRSHIAFAALPLPEAMTAVAERVGLPVSQILSQFSGRLSGRDSADIYSVWVKTLRDNTARSHLKQEDWEWLFNFGKTYSLAVAALHFVNVSCH